MIKIIALIGESGAGKDRILQSILSQCSDLHEIVSCTTRPKRSNEIEGVHYHFYSNLQFATLISQNEMLEFTEFNSWFYGTSKDGIDKDKINIGVFNPKGIENLNENSEVDLTVIRIAAAPKTRISRQLNRVTDPDIDEIFRRYYTDKKDFSNLNFEYKTFYNEETTNVDILAKEVLKYLNLG